MNALPSVDAPEDWLPAQPAMTAFESTLRCPICSEFYTAPVLLTGCGHTFCSGCVREALRAKDECPSCHGKAQEAHVKRIPVLDELVTNFSKARPGLLALLRQPPPPPAVASSSRGMKRKASEDVASRSTRSSGKRVAIAPSSDDEVQIIDPPTNALVKCPICDKQMAEEKVSVHIDRGCQNDAKSAAGWSVVFGGKKGGKEEAPMKRLPAISTKPAVVKAFLKEHGLSTNGTREVLQQRATSWVTIWNANLDAAPIRRAPAAMLRDQLNKKESRQQVAKPDVEKDHQRTYADEFTRLVEQARVSHKPTATTMPSASKGVVQAEVTVIPDSQEPAPSSHTLLETPSDAIEVEGDADDVESEKEEPVALEDLDPEVGDEEPAATHEEEDVDALAPLPAPVIERPTFLRPPSPFRPTLPPASQRDRLVMTN